MWFVDLFGAVVGVSGVLALALTTAVIVMMLDGTAIPPEAWALMGVVWGYYFGKNGRHVMATLSGKGAYDSADTGHESEPNGRANRADRASAQVDSEPETTDQAGEKRGN